MATALICGCADDRGSRAESGDDPSIVAIEDLVRDLETGGQDGDAAILTQVGSDDWIQFAFMPSRGLHFDFPKETCRVAGFDALGPWEAVSELPDLPEGETTTHFSDSQLTNLESLLDDLKIESYYHGQAIFGSDGTPLATSTSFQFDIPISHPRLTEVILTIFSAAHSYRPTDLSVERLRLAWD